MSENTVNITYEVNDNDRKSFVSYYVYYIGTRKRSKSFAVT